MKPPLRLRLIGDLNGVKLNGSVEIAEADDHQEVDDQIQHRLGVDRVVDAAANGALLGNADESPDGGGQGRDGLREDDGQNCRTWFTFMGRVDAWPPYILRPT